MAFLIDQLVQRILLEETSRLLVDADEPAQFPQEEDYYQRLDAEENDEQYDALFIEMLDKKAKISNAQPLVGGPLAELPALASTAVVELDLTYFEPQLRPLKHYCQRVLVKRVLNRFIITLLIDQRVPHGLNRDTLTRIGQQLADQIDQFVQDEREEALKNLSDKEKKKAKKLPKIKTFVLFDIVVAANGVFDTSNSSASDIQASLKTLQQRGLKQQVKIQGYLLDSHSNQVWSTNTITGWRQRRYWRYALRHREQSIADIRQQLENDKPKIIRAVVTGAVALIVAYAIKLLMLAFTPWPPELMFLLDFIIPTIAAMGFCYWQRLNHFASIHVKWFLITYLSLLGIILLALAWPPGLNHFIYIATVGFITYFINAYAALMLEME